MTLRIGERLDLMKHFIKPFSNQYNINLIYKFHNSKMFRNKFKAHIKSGKSHPLAEIGNDCGLLNLIQSWATRIGSARVVFLINLFFWENDIIYIKGLDKWNKPHNQESEIGLTIS